MTATPTVSLLVPVHNRAELLRECLDSIRNQTVRHLDVVVVDGASTDNTWDVCQRFAAEDSRFRVFREETNGGPGPGWARCLEEARGEFGTFVWSDDLVSPTFVERTVRAFAPDVAFVYSAAEIGTAPGCGRLAYRHSPGRFPSAEFIRGSLPGLGSLPVSPACAMFRLHDLRTSFVTELPTSPPTDLRSTGAGTDLLLYLLTAERYPFVVAIDESLAFFRSHPGSITIQGRAGEVARSYAVTKAWFARTRGYRNREARVVARYWLQHARSGHILSPPTASRDCRSDVNGLRMLTSVLLDATELVLSRARGARPRRRLAMPNVIP